MNKCGIYAIVNELNGKIYVGSSVNIKDRLVKHKSALNLNKNISPHLQKAWNKYGEDAFRFSILEECKEDMLIIREQAWIDYYDSMNKDKGYNLKEAGSHGKHSEETKKKISQSHIGIKHGDDAKRKMSLAKKGKPSPRLGVVLSEDSKKKMSLAKKNFRHTEESKKKIVLARVGCRFSEETKKKMSESRKRYLANKKQKENISNTSIGN